MAGKLLGTAIQSGTITSTQLSNDLSSSISAGGGPKITSLIYPGDDTAANTAGGQTIYVNGSGFQENVAVYVNNAAVPATSFISSSNISFTTPALSAKAHPVYVVNTDDGGTAILVPGLEISGEPTWNTAAGSLSADQDEGSAWNYTVEATSDSSITYALAEGSSLPSGVSLASNGLISGTLSSPPGTETTYNFSVVASDSENQDATRAFSVTVSSGEGVLFANNVLLIHADGTNNQNNHTFLDSSNNNFTITRNGNVTQGSFSPFSQTGWSNYFDGSGDYVTIASDNAFAYGTGDFTWEFWFRFDAEPVSSTAVYLLDHGSGNGGALQFFTSNVMRYYTPTTGTGSALYNNGPTIAAQRWYHVAAVRSSGTTTIYLDGVSTVSATDTTNFAAQSVRLGLGGNGIYPFKGHISNFRILKGTALYTSNFTPSTSPLTNIANTSLLTCQSNRFVDNSDNNFAITPSGDVSVQPYSPLAPTSAYSTTNVGGSGYFDGSGDSLSLSSNAALSFGNGNFTVEFWVQFKSVSSDIGFIGCSGNGGYDFAWRTSGGLSLGRINTAWDNGFAWSPVVNRWYHVAYCRSGTSLRAFIDGTQIGTTATNSISYDSVNDVFIGQSSSNVRLLNGYMSNIRLVKGTALYTSNFTPSTSPLTNIANTSLLCNFTNAGIFDQTAKHVIETVGDAKVSTAQYKYGTGSMYFDGSGDYLEVKENKQLFNFGTGDFTIEMWYYAIASGGALIGKGPSDSDDEMIVALYSGIYYIDWGPTSGAYMQGGSYALSQWNHFALVRNGTSLVAYHNGTSAVSTTLTANYNFTGNHTLKIGTGRGGSWNLNGYIDDLRISRFARYTSNFTPPTSALKDK